MQNTVVEIMILFIKAKKSYLKFPSLLNLELNVINHMLMSLISRSGLITDRPDESRNDLNKAGTV